MVAKNARKSSAATESTKSRKATVAPIVSIAKGKPKGARFNGDWTSIPSSRQLLALVIRSIESGLPMRLPTTRDEARDMLGYSHEETGSTGRNAATG